LQAHSVTPLPSAYSNHFNSRKHGVGVTHVEVRSISIDGSSRLLGMPFGDLDLLNVIFTSGECLVPVAVVRILHFVHVLAWTFIFGVRLEEKVFVA